MNAKKCKALRREARAQTVGLPMVIYNHPLFPIRKHAGPTIRVAEGCTRNWYLWLKKQAA